MQTSSRLISVMSIALAAMMSYACFANDQDVQTAEAKSHVITLSSHKGYLPQDMNVTVALPADYYTTDTDYPTVYLLNGHGGNHTSWPGIIDVDSLATRYNCILVCPSGMNSWYFDSFVNDSMRMESFFVEELVPAIDSLYRTRTDRLGRAITGLSMGGHGALWLAIRHSDMFGSAGATSGGVDFTPWPKSWNIKDNLGTQDENPERWASHTVASLVPALAPGQINIIFDCGTEDFFYDVNCALDRALNDAHIPHTYSTSPGAHNGAYWSRSIMPQLEYFSRHF